jgi:putative membrane protein
MMRLALLCGGFVALLGVWLGPLGELLPGPFAAHMTMHMGVVAVAAPLLAFGVCGTRFDPVRRAPALFSPVPASVLELLVVWAWHAPVLHHLARHSALGVVLEQGSFVLSGLLLWLSAFGGDAEQREQRRGAGILALLLTSMHMTLLGALLALPPRPLYAHVHGASRLSPLDDQHLGGAIMLGVGGIVYLLGGLRLTVGVLGSVRARKT